MPTTVPYRAPPNRTVTVVMTLVDAEGRERVQETQMDRGDVILAAMHAQHEATLASFDAISYAAVALFVLGMMMVPPVSNLSALVYVGVLALNAGLLPQAARRWHRARFVARSLREILGRWDEPAPLDVTRNWGEAPTRSIH